MSQAKKIDTLTVKSVSTKISVSFLQTLLWPKTYASEILHTWLLTLNVMKWLILMIN